ncbi:MAG: MFS transporter [Alphaproteobacteria bacterium]|nr:MFS transporter [Alphaproteobacteria bacterium]
MAEKTTNWTGVLFGLAIAVVAAFQQFKLPPVLPLMIERYGYDRVLAGGFMSVFALAGLALSWNIGRWMQRHGALPFLLGAFGLTLAGTLLTLLRPQDGLLVLGARTLEGIGFAVLAIAGPTFATVNAGSRHLPIAAALTATWIPIGQVAAGLIALPFLAEGRWEPLWWVAVAVAVAAMGWTLALHRTGAVDVGARPAAAGLAPPTAAERRAILIVAVVFMLWSAQYIGTMTWLPQLLIDSFRLDRETAVLAYTLPVVVVGGFNLVAGWALRAGVRATTIILIGLAAQALVWVAMPWLDAGPLGAFALVAYAMGAGITPTCLFALPGIILGPGRAGAHAFGILMAGRNLGVIAGPLAYAQAFGLLGDWRAVGGLVAALSLLPILAVLPLVRGPGRR